MTGCVAWGRAFLAAVLLSIVTCPATQAAEVVAVTVHHAYGTYRSFSLEGRVFERKDGREVRPSDSWLDNLRRTLRALHVDEVKGVPLRVKIAGRTWDLRSDDEGYFALRGETPEGIAPGRQPLHVQVLGDPAAATAELFVVPDGETIGIISDIDDTVVVSEVDDTSRLLRHTVLENPL